MAKSVDSAKSPGSNQPTEAEFRSAINILAKIEEEGDAYRARKKRARKEIKAMGFNLGDLDATMKMMDWGRDEVKEHFDRRATYARWVKLPIGTQSSMFGDDTATESTDETAGELVFSKAYQAGIQGKSPECPEQYLDHNQDWSKGWKAGQDSLAMDMLNKGNTS